MPILVCGGIKGGSGKTTLVSNIAVVKAKEGKKILIVDSDEQGSLSDWVEHRQSLGIETLWTTVAFLGSEVRSRILTAKGKYQEIIIDAGGRDTNSQRSALSLADIFLIPFQPRSLDVWTLNKVIALIREARSVNPKLKAYAVINRGESKGQDNEECAKIIQESLEIEVLRPYIIQRKCFSNAVAHGLGVLETKNPDKKACAEIFGVCEALFKCLKN